MQLYMSWYIRSFFGFTFLNILYFFKYFFTNIFHRRSLFILSIRLKGLLCFIDRIVQFITKCNNRITAVLFWQNRRHDGQQLFHSQNKFNIHRKIHRVYIAIYAMHALHQATYTQSNSILKVAMHYTRTRFIAACGLLKAFPTWIHIMIQVMFARI